MALDTEKKLMIAVGVLAVLGGAVYLQSKSQAEEAQRYSLEGRAKELPKLSVSDEDAKAVDRVTITTPAGDAGPGLEVVLVKKGEEWHLEKPVAALANQTNVKSLLDNLKTLKVSEAIAEGTDSYEKYGVTEAKGTHVVFAKGSETVADLWFGEGGTRGQMTRIAGKDGVYAVKGYSSYLYSRDVKGWRDLTLLKFDDAKAKRVEVTNENGHFVFEKSGETWSGTFAAPKKPAKKIANLDESKVKDLLRAFKGLNADGFAEGKTAADVGLATPKATVTVLLEDGATVVLEVGDTAEGSSKWARKRGSEEIVSIGSWTADWATAALSKFEKPDDKKEGDKDKAKDAPIPLPHGDVH